MPLCVTLSTGEFEKMAHKSRQQTESADPLSNQQRETWLRAWLSRGSGGMRSGATWAFVDDEWDGSVADAFARARIGAAAGNRHQPTVQARVGPKNPVEQMGVKKILSMGEQIEGEGRHISRIQRVLVGSVRGQAGKSGIMKGDVVTHVNGELFTGDAAGLRALFARAYEECGADGVVVLVVNADECTAEALRLRSLVR